MSEERDEELEVLSSILDGQELSRPSDDEIVIRVEPELDTPGHGTYAVSLHVTYTPAYPSELPGLEVSQADGDLDEQDRQELEDGVKAEAEASLGMAMIYQLAMFLKEQLTALLERKAALKAQAEADAAQAAHEAELARTRGTPVTPEAFNAWRQRFNADMRVAKAKEEEERLAKLPPKERDEAKRIATKLTGKQLFERNRNLDDADKEAAGGEDVDISQYDREEAMEEDESDHNFSLSDSD